MERAVRSYIPLTTTPLAAADAENRVATRQPAASVMAARYMMDLLLVLLQYHNAACVLSMDVLCFMPLFGH
jgi:hypothetical protein